MNIEEAKIVVKENTVEFLTGSFGDYRTQPKDEVANAAQAVAYEELADYGLSGEEVGGIAADIAEELSLDCK